MRVQVGYTIPVLAIVDTDNGTVERVIVIDEETRLEKRFPVWTEDHAGVVTGKDEQRAIEIAENSDWPVWEHGF